MSHPWYLKLLLKAKKPTSILDRILIGILATGLLLLIAFFAYLLWFTYSNRSITYLLPAQKTIAYFELEDMTLPPKLKQETVLDFLGLGGWFKTTFGIDAKDLGKTVAQGRIGVALLDDGTPQNKPLLFLRSIHRGSALAFMQSLALPDEKLALVGDKENPIYTYPQGQNFVFSFVGPYLLIAQKPETIQLIQRVAQNQEPSLETDAAFQKTLSNLPRQTWARGYLNIQSLSFGADSQLGQTLSPLKSILNHLAFTVRKEYNGFHFNTLLSVQPDALSLSKGAETPERFAFSLADYLSSKDAALYLGGSNLSAEWQNTLGSLSQLNPSYGIILEGILRAQANKIFGDKVSLSDDLYPLFEGEYALSLENLANNQLGVKLILRQSDRAFAEIKLKKLLTGFRALAAQFTPTLKTVTLPDNTVSKELVADSTRVQETDETYKDTPIHCITITDSPYGFCTAVTDQLAILSNHPESIKETLDLVDSPKFVLSQSQPFRQSLSNLSSVSDEITFLDLTNASALVKLWPAAQLVSGLLDPFQTVTWVKHYFTDGVSTEGYLLLK
jgi:Protein of unknown function (DUF3352)